jgi:hypothetical protein
MGQPFDALRIAAAKAAEIDQLQREIRQSLQNSELLYLHTRKVALDRCTLMSP